MLDALVSGTTDPEVLAELAKGHLRKKIPTLKEALEGRFSHRHAVVVGRSSPTSTTWTRPSPTSPPRSKR
jgi:transposase